MNFEQIMKEIPELARSLTYMSETDSDVELFAAPETKCVPLDIGHFAAVLGVKTGVVTTKDYGEWMPRTIKNWITRGNEQQAAGWKTLADFLETNLSPVAIFRVGDRRVRYYIVGLNDSRPIGVTFHAVET